MSNSLLLVCACDLLRKIEQIKNKWGRRSGKKTENIVEACRTLFFFYKKHFMDEWNNPKSIDKYPKIQMKPNQIGEITIKNDEADQEKKRYTTKRDI